MRTSPDRRLPLVMSIMLASISLLTATTRGAEVTAQAFIGQPFGVGVVVQRRTADASLQDWDAPFELSMNDNRSLYPAVRVSALSNTPPTEPNYEVRHYFLFRGDEPLTLKTVDGEPIGIVVTPLSDTNNHRQLLDQWWQTRLARRQQLTYQNAASPLIANFTNAMLARRLSLPYKQSPQGVFFGNDGGLAFFFGTESIRGALQEERLLATSNDAGRVADQPLPQGLTIASVPVPPIPENVEIEPLAQHVPAECFYLRCGSYSNFAWVRRTLDQWGGSFRDLIGRTSINHRIHERLEHQLALHETELSRAFGDVLVKDLAVIGLDTFIREGTGIGVLIESERGALLKAAIAQQRAAARNIEPTATEQTIEIAGRRVALLSTPDHRVRSFFAVDGNFYLVTNSREIVRRFFEAGSGQDSLAKLDEFRFARSQHPLTEPSVAFLHLSDNFFRNLLSPKYRVEMTRRAVADVDIENLELARLAARAEGAKLETLADLFRFGYLPDSIKQRPDGSHVLLNGDKLLDSQRGARGCFVPVGDIEVTKVTSQEAQAYEHFKLEYARQWTRMDPVTINVEKQPLADKPGRQRVVLNIRVCPVWPARYGLVNQFLDPPQTQRLAAIPGSIADIQAHTKASFGAEHILLGAFDHDEPFLVKNGKVVPADRDQWDRPLFLVVNDNMFVRDATERAKRVNERDFDTQQSFGRWIRKGQPFVIVAGSQENLDRVEPHLKTETAARPAQVRLRVGDVSTMKVAKRLTAESYLQEAQITIGASTMLNDLVTELHVAPREAETFAERIWNGRITCPLGGTFQHIAAPHDFARWRSSKLLAGRLQALDSVPNDYRSGLLQWWHGLDLEFSVNQQTLLVRVNLELQP